MALIVKKGRISHVSAGTWGVGRNGNYNQLNTWTFRIDNLPMKLKSSSQNSLSDNDLLTVVGEMKKGSLVIYAFRNETTGAFDQVSVGIQVALGVCFTFIGLCTIVFIVGIAPLFFGLRTLYAAYLANNAKALLKRS